MSWFIVYLIVILDGIVSGIHVLAIISAVVACISMAVKVIVGSSDKLTEGEQRMVSGARKLFRVTIVLCLVFSFIYMFTPTSKQAAAIYLIPKVVNNEDVRDISKSGAKLLKEKLNSYLDEFDGEFSLEGEK
jgi:hypothetical protein